MNSQTRRSKRNASQAGSDSENNNTQARPAKRARQSRLQFSQTAESSTASTPDITPASTPQYERSPSPERSVRPSSTLTKKRKHEIPAEKRVTFPLDFNVIGIQYRVRLRSLRSINNCRISWIYLHGMELEKMHNGTSVGRYWICKVCYDDGRIRVMPCESTSSCASHLNGHRIWPQAFNHHLQRYLRPQHHPALLSTLMSSILCMLSSGATTSLTGSHTTTSRLNRPPVRTSRRSLLQAVLRSPSYCPRRAQYVHGSPIRTSRGSLR